MPQDDPKKKKRAQRLDPITAQMLGIPLDADMALHPWKSVNPENWRPEPWSTIYNSNITPLMTAADSVPGDPETRRLPLRSAVQALNNSFMFDTLYAVLGLPEGGIVKDPRITKLDHVIVPGGENKDSRDDITETNPMSYSPYEDRVNLQAGNYKEANFAREMTHELAHHAQNMGVAKSHPQADSLQVLLGNLTRQAGVEPAANAIAYALQSIRKAPNLTGETQKMVGGIVPYGVPEGYRWTPEDADLAAQFWNLALGR